MKLSTAIRLGAMLRPQAFGMLFRDGGSCAMGAAYEACGLQVYDNHNYGVEELAAIGAGWWLGITAPPCPACNMDEGTICSTVAHLNDDHKWSRERIADYVATLEPVDTPDAIPEEAQIRR